MDHSSLLNHIKLIYTFVTAKEPEWQSLANKVQVQFARNTLQLIIAVSVISYILSGKGIQNILVILLVHSVSLYFMKENTMIFMKFFSVVTCLGIPLVRFNLVGKETALYNHIHISIACVAILLFTDSYALTSCCLIYVGFFSRANAEHIIKDFLADPKAFQTTLQYFLDHYHVINLLIWILISLFVYQKKALLAQLWAREKEKEDLLKQVQKKNSELEKLSQSRTKLLLSLSHEFRNPINSALGNLELANEKILDSSTHKYLTNCKVSIEMLFHLVSNLLDSTKLEAGILELNPLPKSSQLIFHKVWGIVKNLLDKQNLVGEFYIDKKIPEILNVDSHIIIKVLLNLILNAIKYTRKGAVMTLISWLDGDALQDRMFKPSAIFYSKFMSTFAKDRAGDKSYLTLANQNPNTGLSQPTHESDSESEIPTERSVILDNESMDSRLIHHPSMELIETFQNAAKNYEKLANKQFIKDSSPRKSKNSSGPIRNLNKVKGFLKFEVFDTGCGIEDEVVQKDIFQKFSSISARSGPEDRLGLGLGLWLTKSLCEAIGGQVKAYSEKGKGSQFIAIIPAESIGPSQMHDILKLNPLHHSMSLPQLTALVVDDDKYNREISITFMTRASVNVRAEAVNGLEAVEIFKSKPQGYFDFILMDLEMPVMNGKEAIRRIRQFERQEGRNPVKVVIATGNCDLSEYSECMNRNGELQADYFYRKPLVKKDFEEVVEMLKKDKVYRSNSASYTDF